MSQLLDGKIKDSSDTVIGKLIDVLIFPKTGDYNPLEFLVVKTKRSKSLDYIPFEYVETFSGNVIILKFLASKIPFQKSVSEEFIYLKKHVLDQQIVDIAGARVVRVNDLRIGYFEKQVCVLGIDVSTKGLMRRMGIEWMDFADILKVNLLDWRDAQPIHGSLKLSKGIEKLQKLHPADLANIIEDLNMKHRSKIVDSLDVQDAANVFEEVTPELQKLMIKHWGPKYSSKILSQVSAEEIVDLMKQLPKDEARLFISYLKDSKIKNIQNLIIYPDDTAGGLMSPNFIKGNPDWTVGHAMQEIKKSSKDLRSIFYIYMTDKTDKFCGIVSLRGLLTANHSEKLRKIMKKVSLHTVLKPDFKIEKVIEVMTKYDLFTAAVVDDNKRLVGIVSIDDVMRHLFPHA
ncbi:MAG: CBS domain-containing protein [Candidatus Gracilibacteria bacterium]